MSNSRVLHRLRATLIVAALLTPTLCAVPVLALIASGMLRWLMLTLWLVGGGVMVVLVRRAKSLAAERSNEKDHADRD